MKKVCFKCREEKDISCFSIRNASSDGYHQNCKICVSTRRKARQKSLKNGNPDYLKWYKSNRENNRTKYRYGITLERREEMLSEQKGLCALCGLPPLPDKKLYLDHDHRTDQVRGLLHQHCNAILGFADDNPELLQRAINYLKRWGTETPKPENTDSSRLVDDTGEPSWKM